MKYLFILPLIFLLGLQCQNTNAQRQQISGSKNNSKIVIVYLSRTNNTKAIAEMIHDKVGGDLLEIELKKSYSENYQTNVDEVKYQNDNGILPELKTDIDISNYEVIFVGFPTWGMQLPPPVKTFLNENKWSGKTIIPFNTHAGYGLGSSKSQIEKYCAKGSITEVFSVKGGHEREGILFVMDGEKEIEVKKEVDDWLQKIDF